jgi:hypothetical protein
MKLRNVLLELGFVEVWDDAVTDEQPTYRHDFGNLELTAAQVTDRYFRPIFLFGGVVHDSRTIGEICFEIQLEVDSFEQGVAWITYGLGKRFHPKYAAQWIEQGREWVDTLPWERKRRQYEARPHCSVDREWFRVATKKLRELAGSADATERACFEFDGKVLRIKTSGAFLAMPAHGAAWDRAYALPMSKLELLPKRMMHHTVEVSVWEDKLAIGNRRFDLLDPSDEKVEA